MAMLGITMVVLSLAVVVNIRGTSLKQRDLEYQLKEETLAKQVALEEQRAEELGMSAPRDDQVIYVSLSGSDRAEIYEEEKTNILGEIIGAVEESISDLIAYLRPSAA